MGKVIRGCLTRPVKGFLHEQDPSLFHGKDQFRILNAIRAHNHYIMLKTTLYPNTRIRKYKRKGNTIETTTKLPNQGYLYELDPQDFQGKDKTKVERSIKGYIKRYNTTPPIQVKTSSKETSESKVQHVPFRDYQSLQNDYNVINQKFFNSAVENIRLLSQLKCLEKRLNRNNPVSNEPTPTRLEEPIANVATLSSFATEQLYQS